MIDLTGMEEILDEFLVESHENLDRLDQEFVTLESNPQDLEMIASIFRTIHTIKGTSGFFGFNSLSTITHKGENLLSQLRDGKKQLTTEITSTLLSMVDVVREMLSKIEHEQTDEIGDFSELENKLNELVAQDQAADVAVPVADEAPVVKEEPEDPPVVEIQSMGEILVKDGHAKEEDLADALIEQAKGDPRHVGEILVDKGNVQPVAVKEALDKQQQSKKSEASLVDSTLRVSVNNLDRLMNLAGELVLVRNQLQQYGNSQNDSIFNPIFQRLNTITTDLQEGIMKTRMQPIGNVWNKFPRVVRDLSNEMGKKVRLEMIGKDTELDKTLLEAIKDPLTHIVRNSVDHGVENPAGRKAAGKPEEGVVKLVAYHESGHVIIEIVDDGSGINVEKVKSKAIEKGLITVAAAENMTEREAVNLLFLPGFSTAQKVTSVSGRGVGMDVVRTNISQIGGMVDMISKQGQGTTIHVKIPLTLAIVPALTVTCENERYAIPQVNLLELVRLEKQNKDDRIEEIQGAAVYRLRGKLLPLVFLNKELGYESKKEEYDYPVNIVVLQCDDRQFGLVVDEISDTEEIVVKPLANQLKNIQVFAGATIMGDGTVALIIDVLGLAHRSGVVSKDRDKLLLESVDANAEAATEKESMLLFNAGGSHLAIEMDQVERLEEFTLQDIEHTGEQDVIQYRGQILPLVRPASVLVERREKPRNEDNTQQDENSIVQVIVFSENDNSYGLVVDNIIDIVEESVDVRRDGTREGISSVVVIQEKIIEVLDLKMVVSQ
jgi:two-component system, chemotaxis family, sensor kinase CheA